MQTSRNVGEETTLSLNSSKRSSLRTTVPMSLVRQWNLKVGDKLDWTIKICDGELVAAVVKKKKSK
jgi:hypothetical protein